MYDLLDAAVAFGTGDTVLWGIGRLEHFAAAKPNAAANAHLRLARARVAAAASRRMEASDLANEAATCFEHLGWPLPHARALVLGGRIDEARALLRAVGALGELSRLGVTAAKGTMADPAMLAALSQREMQIARLAAGGQSSRQIGVRLGINNRTVDTHLGRIYEKLDIGSRDELRAIVPAE